LQKSSTESRPALRQIFSAGRFSSRRENRPGCTSGAPIPQTATAARQAPSQSAAVRIKGRVVCGGLTPRVFQYGQKSTRPRAFIDYIHQKSRLWRFLKMHWTERLYAYFSSKRFWSPFLEIGRNDSAAVLIHRTADSSGQLSFWSPPHDFPPRIQRNHAYAVSVADNMSRGGRYAAAGNHHVLISRLSFWCWNRTLRTLRNRNRFPRFHRSHETLRP
jgi:hypothetical protein